MLCDLLRRTALAGAPESLFRPADIARYADDWGVTASDQSWRRAYVDAARRHGNAGTSCFGMRIMWRDMPGFLARLAPLFVDSHDEPARLRSAFGVEHYVHLSRKDLVAEAVSLVIAQQSGLWHRNADGSERERTKPHEQPLYDRATIASELQMLHDEAVGWQSWFASNGISPLIVTYEELADSPSRQLARVLAHLGVASSVALQPGTAKLADDLNIEWSERFRAEVMSNSLISIATTTERDRVTRRR
jgi:trehalose 2-sulfotransferase